MTWLSMHHSSGRRCRRIRLFFDKLHRLYNHYKDVAKKSYQPSLPVYYRVWDAVGARVGLTGKYHVDTIKISYKLDVPTHFPMVC